MEKSENTPNRFWKYIRSLIEPPPNVTDIRQRHQARLLSALLLTIMILGGLSGTIQLLTVPGFFPTFVAILGAVIILCLAYFLARTKYYFFAATLTALTPFIATYTALLENTEDQSAFVFMLISVLLSSILLNRWMTLGVALLNLLGLILLPVIQPAWTIAIVLGKVSFHGIISSLILIAMWHRDMMEQDRQRELSESELKFRSIFDNSVDAIGVSIDGLHIMANPAYVRMFGCRSADSLVGKSILDLIAPSERAKIQENIRRRSFGEDVPAVYETRGLRCDGTEFDMEVHVSTYELEGKLYTVPILRDVTERKKTEEALRESEALYRQAIQVAGAVPYLQSYMSGITGIHYDFIGEGIRQITGYGPEEFNLQLWDSLIQESILLGELRQYSWEDAIRRVRTGDQPVWKCEHRIQARDRSVHWVLETAVELRDQSGISHGSIGMFQDITERKQAEESLRLSEERYRALAQNLPDSALLLYDHDLRFIIADGPEIEGTGFSKERLEGKTLQEALPPEFAQLVEPNMRRTLAGEKFYAELPYEGRFYRYSYVPLRDSLGDVVMAMILATNITQLKQVEGALKDSQRRLSTALHATKVGVWEWDMQTNNAYWSDENYRVLGLDPGMDESKYENWAKCVHLDDLPVAEAKVAEAINNKSDLNIEFRVIWPDGSIHWINDIGSVLTDDMGRPLGMYGIQMDITERKQAESERENLIRELETKNIEAETLRESAASVAWSLDLKETASRILDQLHRVVPYDSASVQLLIGNELQIVDGRGFPEGKDPTGMRFLLDQNDPAYPILTDASPYILYSNVQDISDRFIDYFHHHIFSWIAVPLHARGRLIGILTLDGFSAGKFTEDHAHFASTFANQVAVTLENSRLYTDLQKELGERQKAEKELRQREVILDAVAASAELLLKTSDWKVIINEILEKLGWTINASHAYLFEAHPGPEGDTLLSIRHEWSASSFVSDLDNSLYHNMTLHEPGLERWHELVIQQNKPFVGDRVKSSALEMEILNQRGIKAIIDMPIVVDEKWWGVIGFDDMSNDREWTNVEIDALKVAANVLSSAIQRQVYDIALMDELHKRKKLIAELEHKNAELERFTYTVSHDLKSPLVTIKGFLGFIQRDLVSGNTERLNSDLERIGNATKKMEKLLWDLLELSRIGRLVGPSEEILFEDLVKEAAEIVYGQLVAHKVAVRVQPDLPAVFGDRQRLVEVLQNLLDNAAKYMGDQADPRIEIGLRGEEVGKPVFFVQDNGIGIAPEFQERIFGLFTKLDPKFEGTGIGLALVKRIIEFHGGRIWVESEGYGQGSTFLFTLPPAK